MMLLKHFVNKGVIKGKTMCNNEYINLRDVIKALRHLPDRTYYALLQQISSLCFRIFGNETYLLKSDVLKIIKTEIEVKDIGLFDTYTNIQNMECRSGI